MRLEQDWETHVSFRNGKVIERFFRPLIGQFGMRRMLVLILLRLQMRA
jgi:hypothetical protein